MKTPSDVKKIVFCLPGKEYSGNFLSVWTQLIVSTLARGYKFSLSQQYSCTLSVVRCDCLSGDPEKGPSQEPFGGAPYDYILWIDSDQLFVPSFLFKLIAHNESIVAGWYRLSPSAEENSCGIIHPETGKPVSFTEKQLAGAAPRDEKGLIDADYSGLGFMLMQYGVFENIPYPWFALPEVGPDGKKTIEGDDINFCRKAKAAGFKIKIDPTVKVGHEKTVII